MADRQTVAGLAVPTVVAIGAGVLLWFVIARMFPRLGLTVRGPMGAIRP